jgi:hypothetical protein
LFSSINLSNNLKFSLNMAGNDPATAFSSRTTHTGDEALELWSRNEGLDTLGTYADAHDYTSTDHDESGAGTCPEDAIDRGKGTGQGNQAGQPKRQRRPRCRNKLGTDRIVVNRVGEAGLPVSPRKAAQHYRNALGCILRETMSINETNIRSKANENV